MKIIETDASASSAADISKNTNLILVSDADKNESVVLPVVQKNNTVQVSVSEINRQNFESNETLQNLENKASQEPIPSASKPVPMNVLEKGYATLFTLNAESFLSCKNYIEEKKIADLKEVTFYRYKKNDSPDNKEQIVSDEKFEIKNGNVLKFNNTSKNIKFSLIILEKFSLNFKFFY